MKRVFSMMMCFLCGIGAARAAQYSVEGTITSYRYHSVLNATTSIRGVLIIHLSTPLGNGCEWAWIDASDRSGIATALAAKAANDTVTLFYDNSLGGPWGDPTTCGVVAMQLN